MGVMLLLFLTLLSLLFDSNCDVSYGCFDVLCNHGQSGYAVSNSTYIYIPYDIIYDLKNFGNANNYVYNDISICLTIKSYNNINDYKPLCIRVDNIHNDTIIIPIGLKGFYRGYWNISATYNSITETYSNTFSYNNTIDIIEITKGLIPGRSTIINPKYGSILESKLYLGMENDNITIKEANYLILTIAGRPTKHLTVEASKVSDAVMETGSFFLSMSPVFDEGKSTGLPSAVYVEHVLSSENIKRQRVFSDVWKKGYSKQSIKSSSENQTNVCIWSEGTMDGQKSIWLQQIEYFAQADAGIQFTWIIDYDNHTITTLLNKLRYYNEQGVLYNLLKYPRIHVSSEQLKEKDSDGSILPPEHFDNEEEVALYAHKRLTRAGYNISNITPQWLKIHFSHIAETIKGAACDVIVMANNHGICYDKLLSDVGAITGIPVVTELCNLYMDPTLNPSVIVAPSTFAAKHESIRELGHLYDDIDASALSDDTTKIIVIPPIVDTNKFSDEYVIRNGGPVYNPFCSNNCITIGFVARLSVEKSVGLFLMTACIILRTHPNVRFTIVGDGPLKEELIVLANRLEISYAVTFMGWVDDKLPNVLKGIDIIVNPSLRETFCISNLEVMSLNIPLVTFAIWGMGEYIDNCDDCSDIDDYSIVSNAVIVHKAIPSALANATIMLINNSTLRQQLGKAGRATVMKYFHKDRQLDQYRKLYKYLHRQRLSGIRKYGTKENLFTLGNIAKQYDILRNLDYQILKSRGFPSAPNVCLISPYEQLFLYTLALHSSGNILEEGSYCGCSTTFLAAGARDQQTFYENGNSFITSDTFAAGIQNSNSPMRYTVTGQDKVGLKIWDELIFEFDKNAYANAFNNVLHPDSVHKGSMLSCLYSQLFQQNLHHNVTIVAGLTKNIASMINYHLIWSDAAHDEAEINRNAGTWKKIAATSLKKHNIIFCFHDVGADELLRNLVNNIFNEYNILSNIILDNIYAIELSLKIDE